MEAWTIIAIAVAVLAVAAIVGAAYLTWRKRRLRRRFGPEYARVVDASDSRRGAWAELREREQRREQFDIRPLRPDERSAFETRWQTVQADFVDAPASAVRRADLLIQEVMRTRGYPVEDFERRAADLSVDHPRVVEHYRAGHVIARRRLGAVGRGPGNDTEELRRAMLHYRELFDELTETVTHTSGEPRR
ncbi:MAG TPA: hypothetical protein VHF25_08215 [Nitriliruptorales bacterium]|nr:hypothetical protein [Nitriliruptorales bacterium]